MLIHTPRTVNAILKGLVRRRKDPNANVAGIGTDHPFITYSRAGLFDCDYQLHMNNAAYLTHAEFARWELCAYNGVMESMYKNNIHFVVGGTAIRFRREIRPVLRTFEVHTYVARLDPRHFWFYHTFRYPPGGKDPGRIRAQMVCQGLAVQNRQVIDPRQYLIDKVGIDKDMIDALSSEEHTTMHDLMDKFSEMETVFKDASTQDDEAISQQQEEEKK